jgi:RHS repeat-associated protein
LISSAQYNDAGEVSQNTDPNGLLTTQQYDQAGRIVEAVNPKNGKTGYSYNSDSQIAELNDPESQVTTYVYGVDLTNSDLASNDLLREVEYADTGKVTLEYNRQGENTSRSDQTGTKHEYDFDALGRIVADKATVLGVGIDGAIRRIDTEYEVRGMVASLTSIDDVLGTGNIVNQVKQAHNEFGQLVADRQSHGGEVNANTPVVKYTYSDAANDSNQIRPLSLLYPNGRELQYTYGPADGMDDKLNRLYELKGPNNTYARYQYLGIDRIVRLTMPQPDIMLDLWGGTEGKYTGFDRFGRVTNHLWYNHATNPNFPSTNIQYIKHGYDRNSNKLYRRNEAARSLFKEFDWLYSYDDLNQLNDAERGKLNAQNTGLSSSNFAQDWGYDQVGNWLNFNQDDNGDGAWELEQTRAHNNVNEITNINASTGLVWATPQYDAAGNSTAFPNPTDLTSNLTAVYDAWNRMVKVSDGSEILAEMQYDGRTFRTIENEYDNGVLNGVRHFYYTDKWQIVEERVADSVGQSANNLSAVRQFVWGQYVDGLILRDKDSAGNGVLVERLYAVQDSMYSVGTIVGDSGVVQERFEYTPFGESSSLNANFEPMVSSLDWVTRFGGYVYDLTTELYIVRHRWYHAHLGRWLVKDPLESAVGEHLYGYVENNPTKLLDVLGLASFDPSANFTGSTTVVVRLFNMINKTYTVPYDIAVPYTINNDSCIITLGNTLHDKPFWVGDGNFSGRLGAPLESNKVTETIDAAKDIKKIYKVIRGTANPWVGLADLLTDIDINGSVGGAKYVIHQVREEIGEPYIKSRFGLIRCICYDISLRFNVIVTSVFSGTLEGTIGRPETGISKTKKWKTSRTFGGNKIVKLTKTICTDCCDPIE